mmetsp:Transcript_7177/g.19230  ORF Transcript_7177/g.19230 Transcript_7177/m.19230 type:complete len:322 (+) Transcript_7177:511-1476(+)
MCWGCRVFCTQQRGCGQLLFTDRFCIFDSLVLSHHHSVKLFVVNLPVAILICFSYNFFCLLHVHVTIFQRQHDFLDSDASVAVLIKLLKSLLDVFDRVQLVDVGHGGHKLRVIDGSVAINIVSVEHLGYLVVRELASRLLHGAAQLIHRNRPALISIYSFKHGTEFSKLTFGKMRAHYLQRALFELVHRAKLLETFLYEIVERGVWSKAVLHHPWMLKQLRRGRTLANVHGHHFANAVFCLRANSVPRLARHVILTLERCAKLIVVCLAIEWWSTAQQNVENDTERPNVAFLVVLAQKNFGRYVHRCAYLFSRPLSFFKVG